MVVNLIFLMIPFFFTIYLFFNYGAETAIEKSVIPFMILFPLSFNVFLSPYIPLLTFYSCAILPLFIIGVIVYKIKMDFSMMDLFVVLYIIVTLYVGIESAGKVYGYSMLSIELITSLIPYFVIRCFVEKTSVLRILVILTIFISITAIFAPSEFFINRHLGHIYQLFWRGNGLWAPFVRYGFNRVHSSYGHPIHAGVMFSVALMIAVMIYKMRIFKNKKIIWGIIVINIIAMIMTVSRASYVTVVPSIMVFWYSVAKNKKSYLIFFISIITIVVSIALPMYNSYLEIKPGEVITETKSSAIYRKMLFDSYMELAKERYLIGYGNKIPQESGQYSIDNEYLFIALKHGIIPLILFILMHLFVLFKTIVTTNNLSRRENMILWTLMAITVYYAIINYSVWQTGQSRVVLFMVFGLVVNFTSKYKIEKEKKWHLKRII